MIKFNKGKKLAVKVIKKKKKKSKNVMKLHPKHWENNEEILQETRQSETKMFTATATANCFIFLTVTNLKQNKKERKSKSCLLARANYASITTRLKLYTKTIKFDNWINR